MCKIMYTNKKVCYNFKYRITQQLREVIDMIKKEMIAMLLAGGRGAALAFLLPGLRSRQWHLGGNTVSSISRSVTVSIPGLIR